MTTCGDVRALSPEGALGLLSGGDRAAVLDHLDTCEDCRELMHELTTVADSLVLLAPNAEPSSGFEQRVLERIDATRTRRRWPIVVAAAAVLVILGFAVGRVRNDSASPVRELTMRTPAGRVVGDAYLHGSDPGWVFVAVPGWTDGATQYRLRVTLVDGTTTEVPGGDLTAGKGSWGTLLTVDSAHVRTLSLVGADGQVWCSASVPS